MMWHRRRHPPPWWPANEPWPPRHHRRAPPFFVRRLGCGAALLFTAIWLSRSSDRMLIALAFAIAVVAVTIVWRVFSGMNGRLREQDQIRRQLIADVAHELRTPLAVLQGRIEGMLDGVYARDDARLGELLDETRHLSRLVDDVRTLSNAKAGALDLRKEPIDAAELIRDAAASFDAIEVDVPDDLPPLEVDPVRIREVLLNLLSNGVRAGGSVRVVAAAEAKHLIIRVIDTGPGIPPEELPRIFERFTKGADSRGSGLGLAIARKLVQAHGGEIDVQSRVGEGTEVSVRLPL